MLAADVIIMASYFVASWLCVMLAADVIIKETLQSQKLVEGQTATLQCLVDNPKNYPVKWLKNGENIVMKYTK